MKIITRILLLCFFNIPGWLPAQSDSSIIQIYHRLNDGTVWRLNSNINSNRLMIAAGGVITFDFIGMMKLKETWYNDTRGEFHAAPWKSDVLRWQQMEITDGL